jgi:hypothetical protein
VARSFWQHPWFRWYVHEPYDRAYRGGGPDSVEAALSDPLDTQWVSNGTAQGGSGVAVKEMTFQPRLLLPDVLAAATLPIVVTVRDPRLAVSSRMRQLERAGMPPRFSSTEAGWLDLETALALARSRDVPYVLVEVSRLRAQPAALLETLCERLGLPFTAAMLSWPSLSDVALGQLDDEQRHWYARVLASTGFEPPEVEVPELDSFPAEDGMRDTVAECLRVYHDILTDPLLLA